MNNAKNETAAIATSKTGSKERDQQCIGQRIVEVLELVQIYFRQNMIP